MLVDNEFEFQKGGRLPEGWLTPKFLENVFDIGSLDAIIRRVRKRSVTEEVKRFRNGIDLQVGEKVSQVVAADRQTAA